MFRVVIIVAAMLFFGVVLGWAGFQIGFHHMPRSINKAAIRYNSWKDAECSVPYYTEEIDRSWREHDPYSRDVASSISIEGSGKLEIVKRQGWIIVSLKNIDQWNEFEHQLWATYALVEE